MSNRQGLRDIVEFYSKEDRWHVQLFKYLDIIECGKGDGKNWILSELLLRPYLTDAFGTFTAGSFNSFFDMLSVLLSIYISKPFTLTLNLAVNCLRSVRANEKLRSRIECNDTEEKFLLFKIEVYVGTELVAMGTHKVKILENEFSLTEKI